MEKKNVKCPACGVVLEVKNTMNEAVKIITCPQCGASLRVRFQQQAANEPLDARTHLAGSGGGYETQLVMGKSTEGKAFIVCEGKQYELQEGRNIVGRKAKSSTADIQLDVDDLYMSRQNAMMNVYKTSGVVTVTISCYKNKNSIIIGKKELLNGDELVLSNGDEFTMGATRMTMKIE